MRNGDEYFSQYTSDFADLSRDKVVALEALNNLMADKLAQRSSEEVLLKTMIIQGVMAIQSGDNPRNVESKLLSFLPPGQRASGDEQKAAA